MSKITKADVEAATTITRSASSALDEIKNSLHRAGSILVERSPSRTQHSGVIAVATDAVEAATEAVDVVRDQASSSAFRVMIESSVAVASTGRDVGELQASAANAALDAAKSARRTFKKLKNTLVGTKRIKKRRK